jgi:Bacterial pre-peptidase C-terminal domain
MNGLITLKSLFVFSVSLCLCGSVTAGSPRLSRVTPPGGTRGAEATVEFTGRFLDEPKEVLFYEPGITVVSMEKVETMVAPNGRSVPADPGTRVRVKLNIAADCALGAHGLRLRTAEGLTEYHRFFVGPFPTIEEGETTVFRNDKREAAKEVPANTTVFGRIGEAADVDLYKLTLKKGERLSAEVEAARLGVDRGIPDLHLAFFDADGKKLAAADDSALFVQDPVLSILAPKDGAYYVEVRHGMYNGTGEQYRLHVGTFSRPTGIYPAGGPVGQELKVEILGDPRGKWNQSVKLPTTAGDFPFVAMDSGIASASPNRLRVSPFPNVLEAEPNDNPASLSTAPVASLPVAFNGIIDKPGDVDSFVFRAKKGDAFRFHCLANALGSPLDPAITIKALNGKGGVQRSADSRPNQLGYAPSNGLNRESHDPILEFTAPADGEYVLTVEDERGEGGPDAVYRVEAAADVNGIYTYISPEAENQNNPQVRQAIVVAPGNRWTSQISIFSSNRPFNGELELVGLNLPKGVTISAPKLTPGMTRVPVVFEASADAKPQAALVDLVVRPVKGEANFVSGYRQTIMMNQYGNNDYYLHAPVTKLALAVTEPAAFSVDVEEPKTSLVQNGEMLVKFKVNRSAGFDGPVTVQMDWRPLGINTGTPVTVPANATEGAYLVGAARNATAGKHQVTLTAVSGTGGRRRRTNDGTDRTYVATKPFAINVAEPHVEARIARTSIERGKTTTLVLKLNHLQPFEGKAEVTLARLPRGVEMVEPIREITSKDKDVSFTLKATSEALVGNYQGVAMDLTVIEKGQKVRQLSGYGLLRIDAERGAKPGK